jgi:hypothetical protein
MISQDTVDAFNSRQTVNINNIKTMTPSQLDGVKSWGSQAESLLKNRELAMFIHHQKFEWCDELTAIRGTSEEDNNRRICIANKIAGIEDFVNSLKRAVYLKNTVVTQQNRSVEPTDTN